MHLHPLRNCHRRTYSSLCGSICFLCVYKCLCLFIVRAGMYMWMWRLEVDIRCHQMSSLLLFILIFETFSLTEVGVQSFSKMGWLWALRTCPSLPHQLWDCRGACTATPIFLPGFLKIPCQVLMFMWLLLYQRRLLRSLYIQILIILLFTYNVKKT